MARPKSAVSTTSAAEEKNTVEVAETPKETVEASKEVETTKKEKSSADEAKDKKVTVANPKLAYRKVRMNMKMFDLDGEGACVVTKKEAEEFLKTPGFAIVK